MYNVGGACAPAGITGRRIVMKGFVRIEKKYGIRVCEDRIYNPLTGREKVCYKIYTADGCHWENGLTKEGVKAEVAKWGDAMIEMRDKVRMG